MIVGKAEPPLQHDDRVIILLFPTISNKGLSGPVMEYVIRIILEICERHNYTSCKEFKELLDARLPYNLFNTKLIDIARKMLEESKLVGNKEDANILESLIGDLEASIEYDI